MGGEDSENTQGPGMHQATRAVLLEADRQARQRAVALEMGGRLSAGFAARHYPLTRLELRELRRLKTCGVAAVDADTYVALARGEQVPASRLAPRLVQAQLRRLVA